MEHWEAWCNLGGSLLGALGGLYLTFAILGFRIQALPNWVVLLR
jgi:hypothetical protein